MLSFSEVEGLSTGEVTRMVKSKNGKRKGAARPKESTTVDIGAIGESVQDIIGDFDRFAKEFRRVGLSLQRLQPVVGELLKGICFDHPMCWSRKQRATHITATVIAKGAGPGAPAIGTIPGANLPVVGNTIAAINNVIAQINNFIRSFSCPPNVVLELAAQNEIQHDKTINRVCCESACSRQCNCVGPSFSIGLAHVNRRVNVALTEGWQPVSAAGQPVWCNAVIEVDFDLELQVQIGICAAL